MSFNELGLSESIVRAVIAQGYTTPTPIQARAIPEAVAGRDVLGCAQTGTGKTCAFALPILHRLSENKPTHGQPSGKGGRGRSPRALVLCPTRELATQIFDSFKDYSKNLKLRHTVVFGGVPQGRQVRALREGIDVLVATPGRLLDLINQGHIDLSQIEVIVLDEADRMLDMGFIVDIRKVVDMIPTNHQTLFFSATVSREIRRLADSILNNPVTIETAPESTTADSIAQRVYMVMQENKPELLGRILENDNVDRALVFTRTKHGAEKLSKILSREGVNAEAIHGNKTQNARTRTMQRFKSGSTHVLVATDVASRGIDVDNITHVFNFDMPVDPETHVHRIGRTARAGASGIAISFCDRGEMGVLRAIERRTRNILEVGEDNEDLTYTAPPASTRGPATHYTKRKPNFHERPRSSGNRNRSNDRNAEPRSERPARSDRASFSDRPSFSDKPSFSDRPKSPAKPSYADRSARSDRFSNDTGSVEFPKHGKPGKGVKTSDSPVTGQPKATNPKSSKPKTKKPFGAKTGPKFGTKTASKGQGGKPAGKSNAKPSANRVKSSPAAATRVGGGTGHRKGPSPAKKAASR